MLHIDSVGCQCGSIDLRTETSRVWCATLYTSTTHTYTHTHTHIEAQRKWRRKEQEKMPGSGWISMPVYALGNYNWSIWESWKCEMSGKINGINKCWDGFWRCFYVISYRVGATELVSMVYSQISISVYSLYFLSNWMMFLGYELIELINRPALYCRFIDPLYTTFRFNWIQSYVNSCSMVELKFLKDFKSCRFIYHPNNQYPSNIYNDTYTIQVITNPGLPTLFFKQNINLN